MTDTAPQPLDLEPIIARYEAAKPEPWEWRSSYVDEHPDPPDGDRYLAAPTDAVVYYAQSTIWCEDADAEFIAHARSDVPSLVAEVKRLRESNDLLRSALSEARR